MDDFTRAVDAAFEHHGIDGTFDPDGEARAVRLLPTRPDDIVQVGSLDLQSSTALFEIRVSEATGLGKGSILAVGSERFRVQAPPRARDPRRIKYLLNTVQI
ncbi:hypothetical protein [Roseivivax sp. THAF197b]|uniref:head-tail joining protein n=1 Tax=Roseivivax sp. THAF197b TaxID=2588299 RepID=UPI0012685025|nr:hypothetical protein [Roseivivax sp. THAF197b]QFS83986.1 hypothetical protein FIV09_14210 [Roseivivax sp. THAF197b]